MRVFLDSVGCRLNQSELELIASDLRQAGAQLVAVPESSDVIILNTCAVTQAAAADSRSMARRAYRLRPQARIVLTGCWATLDPVAAAHLAPGIEVVPNWRKESIARQLTGGSRLPFAATGEAVRLPIPGNRHRVRGFVKVQEGCNSRCAFCLTRLVRGPARSVPPGTVLERVRHAILGGAHEIVLCGVQLGGYGQEARGLPRLEGLMGLILRETEGVRFRLSSIDPWDVSEPLLALWDNRRLCRQLHLPLQSGSAATLQRMLRPVTPNGFARLAAKAREWIPGLALTTDLIAGFPGETEVDFDISLQFVEGMAFADAHVFGYSPRPGTAAARLPSPVDPVRLGLRTRRLRALARTARQAALSQQVGRTEQAVWVSGQPADSGGWSLRGLTDTGFPVSARSPLNLRSRMSSVHITGVQGGVLTAALAGDDPAPHGPHQGPPSPPFRSSV